MAGEILTYKIEGLKELNRALELLPEEVQRRIAGRALLQGGKVVQAAVAANAPVKTGKLHKSIIIKSARLHGAAVSRQVGTASFAFYGKFSEFGTSRQAPRPWFTPAFLASQNEATKVIIEELAKGIMRYAKRVEKKARRK